VGSALKPVFFGCVGPALTEEERRFFAREQPLGFILFARNCVDPMQVGELTRDLRNLTGRPDTLILIDQEGGRVARLKPPHWRKSPPAGAFGDKAREDLQADRPLDAAKAAVHANARLIGQELHALGINVDCAPMADIRMPQAHDIIGDRAYGEDKHLVSLLALEMAQGLWESGVLPVLKHIPGHGRAQSDSHEELPVVHTGLKELSDTDFEPFRALNFLPLGMTAHILYTALDAGLPATLSPKVIDLIRRSIGFEGLLMSDDISMKALKGDLGALSRQALLAGCDAVLHCNGKMEEMQSVASFLPPCTEDALRRHAQALETLRPPEPLNATDALLCVRTYLEGDIALESVL
jgi:beta-N-acetylhexosaminidase